MKDKVRQTTTHNIAHSLSEKHGFPSLYVTRICWSHGTQAKILTKFLTKLTSRYNKLYISVF